MISQCLWAGSSAGRAALHDLSLCRAIAPRVRPPAAPGHQVQSKRPSTQAGNRVKVALLAEGCPATLDGLCQVHSSSLHCTLSADKPRTSVQGPIHQGRRNKAGGNEVPREIQRASCLSFCLWVVKDWETQLLQSLLENIINSSWSFCSQLFKTSLSLLRVLTSHLFQDLRENHFPHIFQSSLNDQEWLFSLLGLRNNLQTTY